MSADELRARVAELEGSLRDLLANGQDAAADALRISSDPRGETPAGAAAIGRRACRTRAWKVLNAGGENGRQQGRRS